MIEHTYFFGIFLLALIFHTFVYFNFTFDVEVDESNRHEEKSYNENVKNSKDISFQIQQNLKNTYYNKCSDLYTLLRNPDPGMLFKPPLELLPSHMESNFTENGAFPIKKFEYFDDSFYRTNNPKFFKMIFNYDHLTNWLEKIKLNQPLPHNDKSMKEAILKYGSSITSKSIAILGSITIWLESLAYLIGSRPIHTIDYRYREYEISDMKWYQIYDFLDNALKNQKFEIYDNSISYLSIGQAGLGKFIEYSLCIKIII